MVSINPYLTFNGNCEEAFNFYKSVFGGEFPYLGRFKEMPPMGDKPVPASEGEKIMHVSLPVGNTILMGSDTSEAFGQKADAGNNFSISVNTDSKAEADKIYGGLSAEGKQTMPMSDTFWGSYWGMLGDKFGINWMVSCDKKNNIMAKKEVYPHSDKLVQYDKIISGIPSLERKGANVPYTSLNGNMFSYLDKEGTLALRLPEKERTDFLKNHNAKLCEAYGIVQKEYVAVPEKVFADTKKMRTYFKKSFDYVSSLKAKATKNQNSKMAKEAGTKDNPWKLKTPPGTSEYEMYKDVKDGKEIIVCTVGKTVLHYDTRCINDLHAMLKKHGDWMELGSADEQKPAKEGTVEAWGRSSKNPVGGWYGLKKGLCGRFGMYVPPLMETLGLAELTHEPKGNKMKAK